MKLNKDCDSSTKNYRIKQQTKRETSVSQILKENELLKSENRQLKLESIGLAEQKGLHLRSKIEELEKYVKNMKLSFERYHDNAEYEIQLLTERLNKYEN